MNQLFNFLIIIMLFLCSPSIFSNELLEDSLPASEFLSSASLRLLVQEDPSNLSLHLQLAYACMGENDLISAASESITIVQKDENCADAHLYLARALRLLRGNPQKCLQHARKAAELRSELPYQKEFLNTLYYLKHYEEAVEVANRIRQITNDSSILYNLAVIHMRLGQREEMRTLLDEILRASPDFLPAILLKASDCIDFQQFEEAKPSVERVLAADPDNLFARYLRGRIAFNLGEWEQAKTDFEFVVDADPFHSHALFQLVRTYTAMGKKKEAEMARTSLENVKSLAEEERERWRNYKKTHPDAAETHFQLANIYLQIQRGNLAANELRNVLEKNPQHGNALLLLAGIHMASNESEQALPFLDRALDCHPDRISVQFARALALRALGRIDEAKAALKDILQIDPANGKAQQLLDSRLQ
ncbi:MAG: hypothetical protein C4527_29480 [Candidatus Omnitrophota bacterium]|jgi:tetratricopeptide (TPR) repeat protein|nr:MAG: hypothetical protein C4527_29480 [Candidatus Omnitrophota bacterium]